MDINLWTPLIIGGGLIGVLAWTIFAKWKEESKVRPSHGEDGDDEKNSSGKKHKIANFRVTEGTISTDDKAKASERPPSNMSKVG